MDDMPMETERSISISPALPTLAAESSCKRKCPPSVNLVKKLKSGEEFIDSGDESVKEEKDDDTTDDKVEKNGGEADEPRNDRLYEERKVIKMKGALPHLALPDGWMALNHRSGGIIYLHRPTRVCTWSRPYQIGNGSVRKHDVPLAAVPCLHHKRALDKEQASKHSENSTMDTEPRQGATLLNLLNAPEALDSEKSSKEAIASVANISFNDSHVSPQRENLLDTNETMEVDRLVNQVLENGANISQGTEQTLVPLQDGCSQETSDDGSVINSKLAGKEVPVTRGDALSANGLQSSLDVVTGIHNVIDSCPCDAEGSDVKTSSNQDRNLSSRTKINELSKEGCLHGGKVNSGSANFPSSIGFPSHELNKEVVVNDDETVSGSENHKNGNVSVTCGQPLGSNGIDLVDARELENYLSKLWEFEYLTFEQEHNVLIIQPEAYEETELELPASLECLPYSVNGVEFGKQAKDILLDSHNKTPVAILNEHCQRTMKTKPIYVTSECDNPNSPFMAEVQIEGMKYGLGTGTNKKQARQEAAEATLEVLIPGVFKRKRSCVISQDELEFFDKIAITDMKVFNLCIRVNIPIPSQVLQECLKRNHGICPSTINFHIIPGQDQNHSYKITCGKHTATGPCKNKKIGKQLASQAILQKLHPHLTKWGSLLRIYCDRPSAVAKKYKKDSEEEFASDHPNNVRLLLKLKEEMKKLSHEMNSACMSGSSSSSSSPLSVFTVEI